jgi:hypothetical protein
MEYPFFPSVPVHRNSPRLYLAEGVAAVIEVKSNIADEWSAVLDTRDKLKPIARTAHLWQTHGFVPNYIPCFAVGYEGWKQLDTVKRHLIEASLDGILVIESQLCVLTQRIGGLWATEADALWALICGLHATASSLRATGYPPERYLLAHGSLGATQPLRVLEFTGRAISDEQLARIVELGETEVLDLSHTSITDAVLPSLGKLPLKMLYLRNTYVSADALEAFRLANPNCQLILE